MYSVKDNLEDLMAKNNLTLTLLSSDIKIPYKTLSNYINEKYLPNLNTAIKLADYFHCSLNFLVGLSDNEDYGNYGCMDNLFLTRYEKLLKDTNTTHYRVSKDLGFNINISRKWRTGSIPSLAVLTKLADYFGVSIDYLIGRNKLKK